MVCTVDVDLDDFEIDEIIEYLEDKGYSVIDESDDDEDEEVVVTSNINHFPSCSLTAYESRANYIIKILENCCYDSKFLRHLMESITAMPIGSDIDEVMKKLKTICY